MRTGPTCLKDRLMNYRKSPDGFTGKIVSKFAKICNNDKLSDMRLISLQSVIDSETIGKG